MKLHELHRRRLESAVQLIEASLVRMERALTASGSKGIIEEVQATLSPEEQRDLLEKIHQLRAALTQFARTFSLQPRPLDLRRLLNAELSTAWVLLENCRPKRMKGYGVEFEEGSRKALEENVDRLLTQLAALRSVLE